jgi:hypothetical protein
MRWLQVGLTVLAVTAMSGCPSEFGKDGRVNKAVQQDSQEHLLYITKCAKAWEDSVCAPGKEDSDECLKCRRRGVK